VASRSTFGSRRPVPAVDTAASTEATAATTDARTIAGSAARKRSWVSPDANSAWSTWLVTSSPAAWPAPRPTSAAPTASSALRSACQASRSVALTSCGKDRAIDVSVTSRYAYSYWLKPVS
jgi:hypothetical protein